MKYAFSLFVGTAALLSAPALAAADDVPVVVHGDDEDAQLQKQRPSDSPARFDPVCALPCTARVDPTGVYRIAGDGVTPSSSFRVKGEQQPLRLDVRTGSTSARDIGYLTVGVGAAAIITGVVLAFTAGVSPDPLDPKYTRYGPRPSEEDLASDERVARGYRLASTTLVISGAVLAALSVVVLAANGTDVKRADGRAIATAGGFRLGVGSGGTL